MLLCFFLLIVVISFVIFKVNHGYQTIEDCKVYVAYKHRHCQRQRGASRGREEGGTGRDGASSAGHFLKPLGIFNHPECQRLVVGTVSVKFTSDVFTHSCSPALERFRRFHRHV